MVRKQEKYRWRDREHHFMVIKCREYHYKMIENAWLSLRNEVPLFTSGIVATPGDKRALNGDSGTTNPDNLSKPKGDRDA